MKSRTIGKGASEQQIRAVADEVGVMVSCPVCRGSGRSPYQEEKDCSCCRGQGEIPESLDRLLLGIRKDIQFRLQRLRHP